MDIATTGESGEFHWAEAKIISVNEVSISSSMVANPKFLRYAWSVNPGMQVFPFRTEDLDS